MKVDIDAAIARATRVWHRAATHVDCEGAYLDRTVLAHEVLRLQEEMAQVEDSLADAERTIAHMSE